MIVYALFVHKKSVSKRKEVRSLYYFHKKLKIKRKPKKNILHGFLGGFIWVFLGGFFIANPALRLSTRSSSEASGMTTLLKKRNPVERNMCEPAASTPTPLLLLLLLASY
jgi:hypothetical protein